jgi:transcriptional regulator with XRE-family HTH domain
VRLRRLRLERQLSQRELASRGVSYAYISRIEAGARRPSVKALRQLAPKLGVSVEYLMSQGKAEEAGSQFDAAERLFGPRPDPLDLASLRTDQARRAAMLDRGPEAESLAREAVAALGDENLAEQGLAWAALAEALALQDRDAADETFRKAADLLQEHGHDVDFTDLCRTWARYLRRSGRDSEALDVLDQAAQVNASSRTRTLS